MQKFPNIVFIHGSGQSQHSFNYIDVFLPEHNALYLEYKTQEDPFTITKRFAFEIQTKFQGEPFSVVAHSYGCLLTILLAREKQPIKNFVALSSPWGGSQSAKWLSMVFRQSKLFLNVKPGSYLIQEVAESKIDFPVKNIISKGPLVGGGNELAGMGQANDGLLTVATQKNVPAGFSDVENIEVNLSHTEVLLNYDIINIIKETIFNEHT